MIDRHKTHGFTFGTVLMILAVALLAVFGLATLSTFQLQLSTGLENREHARNLAESAVYQAIAEISENPDFGLAGDTVDVPVDAYPEDSRGVLSFDADRAGGRRSTNNLKNKTAAPGDGRQVPRESVHLVGYGRCRETTYQVECLYYRPAFPTGLAVGGAVEASGMTLSGLIDGGEFPGSMAALSEDQIRPADLFANADAPQAVRLGPGCDISGDLGCVGGVDLDPGATVRGEVRPGSAPHTVPTISLLDVRARLTNNGIVGENVSGSVGNLSVPFFTEAGGNLSTGDLNLEGGLLFVNGDLTVCGQLSGRGAVIAMGDIILQRGSDFQARDVLTLASGRNIRMQGLGRHSHFFQGLVYADGDLSVSDLTVVGTVVAHGDARLENVDVLQTSVSAAAGFGMPMHGNNGDDAWWWRINPVLGPELRYDYFFALSYNAGEHVYSPNSPYIVIPGATGIDKTRLETINEILAVADQDYQAGQATSGPPSATLVTQLPAYIDSLDRRRGSGQFLINFGLNEILAPMEQGRIMLWRRI